ncbi:tRNA glutamyl-Q(34) synthetase GluQRS [Luteolibacter sp. GHJ8]|uniref:tRNA glutamyl-Q(34) synthetase GluQRS n=1 Tax=Luteolibacter rhizosphaerae TaxID=2989719 RepID=A0ABT3GAZ5_9BACT|nr:tRNA glutamyl-Q(34) synthetase GluQRS [Luteolibacter rhizosphaerae]MCW1916681.1 tRNA glutamyl-Q(34) synthetase GluQRS [Luteolibacter rhizosphaerae]
MARRRSTDAPSFMVPVVTRFAPSPTGYLHLGHAYAAKVARDLAREHDGRFLLRFEDIDHTRVRPDYYEAAEEDLGWLGLDWDGTPLRQTGRGAAYAAALARLQEIGAVYPCFCTRREIEEELSRMASAPHGPEGSHYPGICRRLGQEERESKLASGASPSWRLDAARAAEIAGPLSFTDLRHGVIPVEAGILGDTILARKDIGTSYHLAVVVDDAFQQVSHVTRGEDLLSSTHIHRILQSLLGFPEPVYLHHELIKDEAGVRLAKRADSLSIRRLRESGMTPAEILRGFPG